MLDVPFRSARQLAADIRAKKIGCLELLDLYLARVEKYDGALNAIVVRDVDRARTRARAGRRALAKRQPWGPLHGVPMTIKESYDVAGLPTTWGVPAYAKNVAAKNAVAVDRLLGAGAVLFGKTNVPAVARATGRASTPSTARPTIRGTSRALPAAPRAARPRRWPPGSPRSRRAATSARRSATPRTSAASTATSRPGASCRAAARRCRGSVRAGRHRRGRAAGAQRRRSRPGAVGDGGPRRDRGGGLAAAAAAAAAASACATSRSRSCSTRRRSRWTARCRTRLQALADFLAQAEGEGRRRARGPPSTPREAFRVYIRLLRAATVGPPDRRRSSSGTREIARGLAPDDESYYARTMRADIAVAPRLARRQRDAAPDAAGAGPSSSASRTCSSARWPPPPRSRTITQGERHERTIAGQRPARAR